MEREWKEMEPTLGNYLRLEAEILRVKIIVFFLQIKRTIMETALWLLRNGCM